MRDFIDCRTRLMRRIVCSAIAALAAAQAVHASEAPLRAREPIRFAAAPAHSGAHGESASLREFVAEALRMNPEVRAAEKELEAARQRVLPAGALDDPMLEMGVLNIPARSLSFSSEDMTMKMLGLSQRIPYPGKRALKRDIAEKSADSVSHAYEETVNRIVREVKTTYLDLALVQESGRVVGDNRSVVGHLLKIVEGRHEVGRGSQLDVLRAQTQLSRLAEEQIKIDRERPMLESELNRLLGRAAHAPAPHVVLASLDSIERSSTGAPEFHENAWTERPQLRALQAIAARSERALELARKDRYPDFDLRFSYGQRDNMPDGTRRADLVSMTVAINLPVWRATKTEPRIAEAQAMHDQAVSLYEAQRIETATKLHHQMATAEQALRAARLYRDEILPQARVTFEAALSSYQQNRGDSMPLFDVQMSIVNAELGYVAAITGYGKALAEIEFLTGRATERALSVHQGSTP
jgi:outer membrane protein, heavy metal efflux system